MKSVVTHQLNRNQCLLIVIFATLTVYALGHFEALTNPYVINDDVRQQIYWMQRWQDPELFQDDLLTRYAENYVPVGVKSIYYVFSGLLNPVQFSKVLTAFLFILNAALLFLIGSTFSDELTSVVLATSSFLFTSYMTKISGGMSQSFAYPLMLAYIYFLASEKLLWAGLIIMIQSVFNPYIFVLCSVTHALYMLKNFGGQFLELLTGRSEMLVRRYSLAKIVLLNVPVLAGALAILVQHVFLRSAEFGELISWVDIYGHIEYTSSGRYQLQPGPDLYWEMFRPVVLLLLYDDYGPVAGTISGAACLIGILWAVAINKWDIDLSRMGFIVYLAVASLILYFVSYEVAMKLFLPRRYIEFSFNFFYSIIYAICISSIIRSLNLKKFYLLVLLIFVVIMGGLRLNDVGIYNFSKDTQLYEFLLKTPKNSVVAGPPEVMDNVVTFARRKAFITFELSHTWFTDYWKIIRKRTMDFFDAYYSSDPESIRKFAQDNGVDYMIVRERDFKPKNISKSFQGVEPFGSAERSTASNLGDGNGNRVIYFEPFQSYIHSRFLETKYFALLDDKRFEPVFKGEGYRIVKLR